MKNRIKLLLRIETKEYLCLVFKYPAFAHILDSCCLIYTLSHQIV